MPPSQAAHLGAQIQTPLLQNLPTLGQIFRAYKLLTLKGQCKPHGLGIILGESCS
jgi:hypothetical protein